MPTIDLVHDIQIFINVWKSEFEKMKVKQDYLFSKYGIRPSYDIDDEYMHGFVYKGSCYGWDYGSEELYLDGDDSNDAITSGEVYEYAVAQNQIINDVYDAIKKEMNYRGWYYDPDEYGYYLFKDGWSTDLVYFPFGEWDDVVGEFENENED